MGEDVRINGTKLPWPAIIAVLTFTFWLGGLSIVVAQSSDDITKHEAEPAHAAAALATNTLQADVKHNTEELKEIKSDVKDIKIQMAEDKEEILEAIRGSN